MDGKLMVTKAYPVLALEHRGIREMNGGAAAYAETENCPAVIESVDMEESGPLQCVFCFKGAHGPMRFAVRMYLWTGSPEIRFVHTFFFAGKEEKDYLKCMGIRFEAALAGPAWERHVKIATDRNLFHEAAMLLFCNHPRVAQDIYQNQIDGGRYVPKEGDCVKEAVEHLPMWNRFAVCQDSPSHFQIKKQIRPECCTVSCLHGYRAPGVMAVAGEAGGLMVGIKDFWQKYPSGLEADGLGEETTRCTAWFYSPEAEAYDFRHYTTESYNLSLYEGFEKPGPSAYGIAVTSECLVKFTGSLPSDGEVKVFADRTAKGPVYVGTPEYYPDKRAFGYWSLRKRIRKLKSGWKNSLTGRLSFIRMRSKTGAGTGCLITAISCILMTKSATAGDMAAYAARETGDQDLMETTWKILADAMLRDRCGIEPVTYAVQRGQNGDKELQEEPWISTNFISQWCLNVIVALEFIREALPESMDTLQNMAKDMERIASGRYPARHPAVSADRADGGCKIPKIA